MIRTSRWIHRGRRWRRRPVYLALLIGGAVVLVGVVLSVTGRAWLWPVLVPVIACVLGLLLLRGAWRL
jgi:uncharacterized membrane protein YoaK (UPF0700 family)